MATTRFYDIIFINKANGKERAWHVDFAKNKKQAIDSCYKAIATEYHEKINKIHEDNPSYSHVTYDFDGIRVTAMPLQAAYNLTAQRWVVKQCKITTIAGSYSKKRNPDGSKKRKRNANKQDTAPAPKTTAPAPKTTAPAPKTTAPAPKQGRVLPNGKVA